MNKGNADYILNLSAGTAQSFYATGDFWRVVSAADPVQLKFDDGKYITRVQGSQGEGLEYQRVTVVSATTQAVTLALGYGRETESTAEISVEVDAPTIVSPTGLSSPAAVAVTDDAATLLSATDPDKREVHITNPLGSGVVLFVGDSNVDGTHGTPIYQGSTYILSTSADVYGWQTDIASVSIPVNEIYA